MRKIEDLEEKLKKHDEVKTIGFGYRRRFCSNCKKMGHSLSYCRNLINKNNNRYIYSNINNKKRRKVHYTGYNLDEFKKMFPKISGKNIEKIQFCRLEKCSIKTQEGKIVIQ